MKSYSFCSRRSGKTTLPIDVQRSGSTHSPSNTFTKTDRWPALAVTKRRLHCAGRGEFCGIKMQFFLRPVCTFLPSMPRLCALTLTILSSLSLTES